MTECNQTVFPFEAHFSRRVVAKFDGAQMTTEGGALLLRETDRKIELLKRVAACFTDTRDPQRIEHGLSEMLAQRIYGLALGYEDLNDHEELRRDPLLGVLAGKRELSEPLAGKSTLNRLELTPAGEPRTERYHKNGLLRRGPG
jgi:Transposase DDE domain group 1